MARGRPFLARLPNAALSLERLAELSGSAEIVVKNQVTAQVGRVVVAELCAAVTDADDVWYAAQQPIPEGVEPALPPNPVGELPGVRKTNFWLGSARAHTSLHQDHMHNLVIQLAGRKRFTLFAPGDAPFLYREQGVERFDTHSQIKIPAEADLERFPLYAKATPHRIDLEPGDALFMPAYWWHEVSTLEPSLMLNTWWPATFSGLAGNDVQPSVRSEAGAWNVLERYQNLSAYADDGEVVLALSRAGLALFAATLLKEVLGDFLSKLAARQRYGRQLTPATAEAVLRADARLTASESRLISAIRNEARLAAAALAQRTPAPVLHSAALGRRLKRAVTSRGLTVCTKLLENNRVWLNSLVADTYV